MPQRPKTHAHPPLACEIFPDRVVAARLAESRQNLELHTSRQLPAGTVKPSLTNQNVLDASMLSGRISEALSALSARSRDVITIIPDAAARVVLLDFEQLPESPEEATGVLRFRLKKSLPFDVEKAVISYHAHQSPAGLKVVAVVALASVREEYEMAFTHAGYSPGIVLPSTLAALGMVDGATPTMVIKVSDGSATVAIVDQNELRLLRTLEVASRNGMDPVRLADEVYPSLVFFEDQFGASVQRVLIGGAASARDLAPALGAHSSAPVEDLVDESYLSGSLGSAAGSSGMLAGVAGALLA
ncbi:MAG TPA: hypothetical protein VGR50_01965 [Terriglobales bacterium]|nr:hypothetical protein [Terriglobales bacterium]